ncbi:MAG: hypothetical protein F9K43_03905 [Bauldia sp.]|nr:MAG: hypothetical protein F9K43_03905 [Bauldia sp.]MBZ0228178.1 hypothetical protein [Bauldia sp.]
MIGIKSGIFEDSPKKTREDRRRTGLPHGPSRLVDGPAAGSVPREWLFYRVPIAHVGGIRGEVCRNEVEVHPLGLGPPPFGH